MTASSRRLRVAEAVEAQPVDDEPTESERLRGQLLAFAVDINRLYRRERLRARDLEAALADLEEAYAATVRTLAFVVEARDPNTRAHLDRADGYALALTERIAPELTKNVALCDGFLLHDIGKVGIPERILGKPGPLSDEEWEVMRTHPIIGGRILAPIKFFAAAIPIVEAHHERWDGTGYPRGLRADEIPLAARIFAVVDTFDAMTSDRPYRRALSFEAASEEIRRHAGSQFDPQVVKTFLEMLESDGKLGSGKKRRAIGHISPDS